LLDGNAPGRKGQAVPSLPVKKQNKEGERERGHTRAAREKPPKGYQEREEGERKKGKGMLAGLIKKFNAFVQGKKEKRQWSEEKGEKLTAPGHLFLNDKRLGWTDNMGPETKRQGVGGKGQREAG